MHVIVLQRGHRLARASAVAALGLVIATAHAAGGNGYTWGKFRHDGTLGIDLVGNGEVGDPYAGDTSCQVALPLLCVKLDGSPRPNYAIDTIDQGLPKEGYRGWIGGHLGTTQPILGSTLTSRSYADHVCAATLGSGWRMAEFHDGRYVRGMDETHLYGNASNSPSPWPAKTRAGGFDFLGFGNVRDDTRYWVRIDDQPANCWNP
jgi:hypothetical protein